MHHLGSRSASCKDHHHHQHHNHHHNNINNIYCTPSDHIHTHSLYVCCFATAIHSRGARARGDWRRAAAAAAPEAAARQRGAHRQREHKGRYVWFLSVFVGVGREMKFVCVSLHIAGVKGYIVHSRVNDLSRRRESSSCQLVRDCELYSCDFF